MQNNLIQRAAACLCALTLLLALSCDAMAGTVLVRAGSAKMYASTGKSARLLGELPKGTELTLLGVSGGIAKVRYAGKTGYVKKSALKREDKSEAAADAVPATGATKAAADEDAAAKAATRKKTQRAAAAYAKPDTSARKRVRVPKGTAFSILGETNGFYQVRRSGVTAYLLKEAFTADAGSATPQPETTPKPQNGAQKTVARDAKLYRRASVRAKVVATLTAGSTVTVYATRGRFAKVTSDKGSGFLPVTAFEAGSASEGVAQPQPTPQPTEPSTDAPSKSKADIVLSAALAQLGKPYVFGSSGMSSFDCSGLTRYAYGQVGVDLPHSAQAVGYSSGSKVVRDQLERGDVVCFNTVSDNDLSDHVGIYMGDGQFVHASSGQHKVTVNELVGFYSTAFSWGRRVL